MDTIEYLGCVKYDHIGIRIPSCYLVNLKLSTKPYYIRGPCRKGIDLSSLKPNIKKILDETLKKYHETRMLKFINSARALTNKLHQLDALKLSGKLKKSILQQRNINGLFKDLADFNSRTGINLHRIFMKSLLKEIMEQQTDIIRIYLSSNE